MNQPVVRETFTDPIPRDQRAPSHRKELLAIAERDWSEPAFTEGDISLMDLEMTDELYAAVKKIADRNNIDFQVQGKFLLAFKR